MANDILIVDDEADIRDLVAGILDDEGFSTRTARDSDSALAEVANRRPHRTQGCLRFPVRAARRLDAAAVRRIGPCAEDGSEAAVSGRKAAD